MGLRELKKNRLRRTVQAEALRLFTEQGYAQTTVDQIAEAAEISTTTFYRHYTSKEDVVFTGDSDPSDGSAAELLAERPPDEPLSQTMRAILHANVEAIRQDKDILVARMRLILNVPELRDSWLSRQQAASEAASLLASRRGGDPASEDNRFAAAVLQAGLLETVRSWVNQPSEPDVDDLVARIDRALDRLAPVIDTPVIDTPVDVDRPA